MTLPRTLGGQFKISYKSLSASDVDSNASGDVFVTFSDLKNVYVAFSTIRGGYKAEKQSIFGNTVVFRIFQYDYAAAAAGPAVALASTADIAAMDVVAIGD